MNKPRGKTVKEFCRW